jgi:hypothetical protein
MAKNMSPAVTRPAKISTASVPQKGPMSPSRKLPGSNHGPCCCTPTKNDRITGIPDYVLRPARMEVDLSKIGPGKKVSQKGYEVVGLNKEPMGLPSGKGNGNGHEAGESY